MVKQLIFSILFIISALSGSTQEIWTLEKCINHALQNNLNISQLRIAEKFTDLDLDQANHARYPNLNGASSLNSNFGRTIDPVTNAFSTETFFSNNFSLNSGVVLYNGGRIKNTIKQAEISKQAAGLDIQQSERDIALFVANAYLSILFAEENQKIISNQLSLSKEQLKQLEKLINAGTRPANERLTLDAQIALNEQNLITAKNNVDNALLNLKQLMRIDANEEITVVRPEINEVKVNSDADLLSFDEVYNSALKTQPNIRASELDVDAAQIGVDIAKSSLLPSISAGVSLGTNYSNRGVKIDGTELLYQDFNIIFNNMPTTLSIEQESLVFVDNPYFSQLSDNLSIGAGVQLNIPIYNNRINHNNVERSKLNIQNIEIGNEILKDNLKTNVQQALADARTAKRALEAASFSLEAQKAAFANAQKRYDLGNLNTYNFIDAKNQLDNAQLNYVIAKFDYLFKSKVIDFYMGYPLKLN